MKAPNNWTIQLVSPCEPQYSAGSDDALINGYKGTVNWRMGNWQGFQKATMEAIIDLKEMASISTLTTSFLQDTRAWIIAPKKVMVEISTDGKTYTEVYAKENFLPIDDLTVQIVPILANFPTAKARYVKLKAVQYGKLPVWHEGAGGDSHIFIDEIRVQ